MCYKYSRLYNKYQKKCSFFLIRSIVHAHKQTQADTSSPSPLPLPQREGSDMRDTPCGSQIFPLIITQTNCFQHSPSLQERGLGGVRLFFYMQKGRRKIIFYIFPFGLYSFLSPQLSTPSLRGRRLEKRLNCFTDQCRLDGCCT